jgi:hypothetical protein
MHPKPPVPWMPADAWAAERNVTPSQFILAAKSKLPPLPARSKDGDVLVDTHRGYAWLQLLELKGLRPDSNRAPKTASAAPEPSTA